MTLLVAVVVGFLAARLAWVLLRPVFAEPVFLRDNYRGHAVPTAAGVVLAVAVVAVESGRTIAASVLDDGSRLGSGRAAVLVLVIGFALLGLLDDIAGSGDQRGFRGHVRALAGGRLTTGGLKMLGGAAVAVLAADVARPGSGVGDLLVGGVLIALAANLGNLFDRAPGRAIKVGALAFVVLAATTAAEPDLAPVAVVVGATLGLLLDDLREHLMLGDTGANVIGGALGLGVVIVGSDRVRLAVLGVLAILNGLSEWVSFSEVIDRVTPLRVLDRAGRRRADG